MNRNWFQRAAGIAATAVLITSGCTNSNEPEAGSLLITVTGPPGAPASITVTGPAGFTENITATTTLATLTPGKYTITASNVTVANTIYAPTPASVTVTVAASNTAASASVVYAVASGALTITVSGLPSGSQAAISVTGPAGFSQAITATTTLSTLTPGSYTIAASTVMVYSAVYGAAAPSVTVTVPASTTPATASVAYAPTTTFLSFVSDPGDYIGGGQTVRYAFADGVWSAGFDVSSGTQHFGMNVMPPTGPSAGWWWYLDLAAPQGQALAVGTFTGATRYPFQAVTAPGLDFYGSGRGCNMLTGQFQILHIDVGPGNTVNTVHALFEQHCEGMTPALRGEVAIAANPWR